MGATLLKTHTAQVERYDKSETTELLNAANREEERREGKKSHRKKIKVAQHIADLSWARIHLIFIMLPIF